jgi:hypothetical protein
VFAAADEPGCQATSVRECKSEADADPDEWVIHLILRGPIGAGVLRFEV